MSHVKITGPDAYNFNVRTSNLIKYSSRGLIGDDKLALIKCSSEEFVARAKKVHFSPDEIPLHVIAMGSTEGYGPNRNADGFKEASLRKYAQTFVNFARIYQHHKNKDPDRSYGVVKMAMYNDAMRRIELLLALNKSASAATRNGGLVDEAFVKAAESGEDIPWSMACKIPFDVCAVCDNKAPTRNEYCESIKLGGTCTGLGCKSGLGEVLESGLIQHVDNPDPCFFDISRVSRPADRTAYGGLADYLQKAASLSNPRAVIGGAKLAELLDVAAPEWLHTDADLFSNVLKMAAEAEDRLHTIAISSPHLVGHMDLLMPSCINVYTIGKPGSAESLQKLAALSANRIVLSPRDFVYWITGDEKLAESLLPSVRKSLIGIYSRMAKQADTNSRLYNNEFDHRNANINSIDKAWAESYSEELSLTKQAVQRRAIKYASDNSATASVLATINSTKNAKQFAISQQIAENYAMYKLAFLASQSEDLPLTTWFAIRQNYCC
jgi:hypothetical protein